LAQICIATQLLGTFEFSYIPMHPRLFMGLHLLLYAHLLDDAKNTKQEFNLLWHRLSSPVLCQHASHEKEHRRPSVDNLCVSTETENSPRLRLLCKTGGFITLCDGTQRPTLLGKLYGAQFVSPRNALCRTALGTSAGGNSSRCFTAPR